MRTSRRAVMALAALAAASSVVAAGPASAVAPAACSTSAMKPFIKGSVTRQYSQIDGSNAKMGSHVSGSVIGFGWKELEPGKAGAYTFTALDAEIGKLQARGMKARLRVTPGVLAPDYVKRIGGNPIPFFDHQRDVNTTIGRFWTPEYQARWQALQRALAARYDANLAVGEVNIGGTGLVSEEPMLMMANDVVPGTGKTNGYFMAAAGLTEAKRRSAFEADIRFMQDTWKKTHTTLFAHPYQQFQVKPLVSLDVTKQIVTMTNNRRPGHTSFGHTGVSSGMLQGTEMGTAKAMLDWFLANKLPVAVQTQSYSGGGGINLGVADLGYLLDWAAKNKVMSVELPFGWIKDTGALAVIDNDNKAMVLTATAKSSLVNTCTSPSI